MLIVLAIAVVGVLVEAFPPRPARYPTQMVLALGGQAAALAAVISQGVQLGSSPGRVAVVGAVAVDRPALFLQGTLLLIGILATLLIGQRIPSGGLASFTAASLVGTR